LNAINRSRMVLAVAIAMAVPLSILAYQQFCRWTDNFYEVVPGQFYRSAQLTSDELAKRIDRYAIKTVINLRGVRTLPDWYQGERHLTELRGVRLIDFPMSASKVLQPERALALVNLMKNAPKPILVHCFSGADRTGLVSVIYVSQVAGIDEETAERQLSPYYGHFGIPFFSPTFAMDESWERLESVFGVEGS
jgi:protein tyrosine/serine phosphatase